MSQPKKIRKIAAEEAFCIPEVADELAKVARAPGNSLDIPLLKMIYDNGGEGRMADMRERLIDLEDRRLKDMDANGVDMHLLMLTAPGLQMFDADTAIELAVLANDRLAEVIARHPTRFAGLAAVAPQSPKRSAKELERAITKLKLNGLVINSHTNDEYLDDPKYFPLLEAAEALGACIYIHPRAPSAGFDVPLRHYALDGALWGYGLEVSTHVMRLICGGIFDRFPRLRICIGHMGEAIHFWRWRVDFMSLRRQNAGQSPKLQLGKPSAYMKRNVFITTSGVEDDLALEYSLKALGEDNVLWAIDYPYQPSAPAVQWMDAAPVPEEVRSKLYHQNAERLFHIAPGS
jgi:2,3-dihydroxybenzoate decarboxylase/5-carboxyvanillate decarboxylase